MIKNNGRLSSEAEAQDNMTKPRNFAIVNFWVKRWGLTTTWRRSKAMTTSVKTDAAPPVHMRFPPVIKRHKRSPAEPRGWTKNGLRTYLGIAKTATMISATAKLRKRKSRVERRNRNRFRWRIIIQTSKFPTKSKIERSENATTRAKSLADSIINLEAEKSMTCFSFFLFFFLNTCNQFTEFRPAVEKLFWPVDMLIRFVTIPRVNI